MSVERVEVDGGRRMRAIVPLPSWEVEAANGEAIVGRRLFKIPSLPSSVLHRPYYGVTKREGDD